MPHAPCPILRLRSAQVPDARCPMPHAPCPMPYALCPIPHPEVLQVVTNDSQKRQFVSN